MAVLVVTPLTQAVPEGLTIGSRSVNRYRYIPAILCPTSSRVYHRYQLIASPGRLQFPGGCEERRERAGTALVSATEKCTSAWRGSRRAATMPVPGVRCLRASHLTSVRVLRVAEGEYTEEMGGST